MNNYLVNENQTLLDVSAHVYGRVDLVMALSLLNDISTTEVLTAGQIIKLIEAPINSFVKKSIENRNIIPATAISQNINIPTGPTGIGSMIIETNFIVA
jgi:hypothetical protein